MFPFICPHEGISVTLLVCLSAPHSYMSIVESLPTYGVHYYAVKVQIYNSFQIFRAFSYVALMLNVDLQACTTFLIGYWKTLIRLLFASVF